MKTKNMIIFAVMATIAGFLLVSFYGLLYVPKTPAPKTYTHFTLKEVYHIVEYLAVSKEQSVHSLLSVQNNGISLQEKLGHLIYDAAAAGVITKPSYIHQSVVVDGWNSPVNVAWRSELPSSSNKDLLNSSPSDLILWSSGPNKVNEYGAGDDVF